jgi:DNA-binding transcriptional regulator YhcF (GntR family)
VTTELRVDLDAATPVYEQIRAQVAALVAVGALGPGDRLPASRDLARDLGVAVGTVQRAYREPEAQGVVRSRRRAGTIVTEDAPAARRAAEAVAATLLDDVRGVVRKARELEIDDAELLTLVRGALAERP